MSEGKVVEVFTTVSYRKILWGVIAENGKYLNVNELEHGS